jgi:hypothetical protein
VASTTAESISTSPSTSVSVAIFFFCLYSFRYFFLHFYLYLCLFSEGCRVNGRDPNAIADESKSDDLLAGAFSANGDAPVRPLSPSYPKRVPRITHVGRETAAMSR